jgi:hypothetical protein
LSECGFSTILTGAALMGIGCVFAMGCTIGGTEIPVLADYAFGLI